MYEDRIRVLPGYNDIFELGGYKSVEEIGLAITKLDCQNVMNVISTLILMIINESTLKRGFAAHLLIAGSLASEHELSRIKSFAQTNHPRDNVLLFSDQVLTAIMKVNFVHNNKGGLTIDTQLGRSELLKIILSMNSIWTSEMMIRDNGDDLALKEKVRVLHAVQFLTYGNEPIKNMLVRGNYYIEKYAQNGYDKIFYESTGIEIKNYLDMIFMLSLNWSVVEFESIASNIFKSTSFLKNLTIPEDQVNRFTELISFESSNFVELNKLYTGRLNIKQDNIYNQITFMIKPVQRIDDLLVCTNPYFVAKSLLDGPYNIVRESLKGKGRKAEDGLPQMMGNVFEGYISKELKRAFKKRYLGDIKSPNKKEKSIDGILVLRDIVLLIEIKSSHMTFETRVKGRVDLLKNFIYTFARYKPYIKNGKTKTSKKGFGQIKQFIVDYKEGRYKGIYNFGNKKLIPVVVLAEEFPFDPLNREILYQVLEEQDCIADYDDVGQPIIFSAEEVELIHSLASARSINSATLHISRYVDAMDRSLTLPYFDRATTLKNYLHSQSVKFLDNKLMRKRFHQVTDRMLAKMSKQDLKTG